MSAMKKLLLLVGVAVAAVALAAPAAAQAEEPSWYLVEGEEEGEKVAESESEEGPESETAELEAPNEWTMTVSNGFVIGPCSFSRTATIWNTANGGQSKTTAMSFTTPCKTSLPGCTATAALAEGLPWPGVLTFVGVVPTEQIGTKAKPMKFKYVFSAGCGGLAGVILTATAQGPVPAEHVGKGCYKYNKAGNFALSFGGLTATADAEDCRVVAGKAAVAK